MAKTSAEEKPEITSTGPRDNTLLLGHEAIETQLASVIDSSRLPQSLLITGAKGIGKATFAYRLARFLLAYDGKPQDGLFGPTQREGLALAPDHHVIRRMSASSHPDFLVIEPEFDEKKKERKAEIGVDIARKIGDFFSLTPAESLWRVVVVDAVDDMNRNAANAILKVLEEPPQRAVLLLVSHNPGRLLPTALLALDSTNGGVSCDKTLCAPPSV